jgi:hypothetical protein
MFFCLFWYLHRLRIYTLPYDGDPAALKNLTSHQSAHYFNEFNSMVVFLNRFPAQLRCTCRQFIYAPSACSAA